MPHVALAARIQARDPGAGCTTHQLLTICSSLSPICTMHQIDTLCLESVSPMSFLMCVVGLCCEPTPTQPVSRSHCNMWYCFQSAAGTRQSAAAEDPLVAVRSGATADVRLYFTNKLTVR